MRKYYSHSQQDTFTGCGQKYKFRYVDGIETQSSSNALVFGSAIHKSLEKYHLSILDARLTAKQMMDEFENAWETAISEATTPIEFKKGEKDQLFEIGLDLIIKYHKDNTDIPPPVMFINEEGLLVPAVEIDFTVAIDHPEFDISMPIHGKIDLITPVGRGKNPDIYIIDHKTASEDYNQFQINTSIQLSLYAVAFRKLLAEGRFPYLHKDREDAAGYNIFRKIPATKIRPENSGEIRYIRKTIEDEDIAHMSAIYGMMDKSVRNGIFMPNYGRHCKWCEYANKCSEYKYRSIDEKVPDTSPL